MDKTDDSTHKLLASFIVKDENIVIDEIREGHSLEYVLPRVPISSRGSTLFKPKEVIEPESNTESTSLEYKEVKDMRGVNVAPLKIGRDIPHPEVQKLRNKNYVPFAGKK